MSQLTRKSSARSRAGLSVVELTLLISVLAVVASAAGPAFLRAVRVSKVAEAPYQLARLQHHVAAYYAAVHQTEAGARLACLPDSGGPVPALPADKPVVVVFAAPDTPASETFRALGFEPGEPIRYRYTFATSQPGCDSSANSVRTIAVRAEGDLDGDSTMSVFERSAVARGGELEIDPLLFVRDRVE